MNKHWFRNYKLLNLDEIDSTNSEAIRLAKTGIMGNHIILAKRQTSGRGRNNKYWHSCDGNLYFSLLLDIDAQTSNEPQLSIVTGLAVYETIKFVAKKSFAKLDCKLKWPNDILIGDKKLSGILLESINVITNKPKLQKKYLIIGVGINVITNPTDIHRECTNLLKEGIIIKDLQQLLFIFMNYFEKYFIKWHDADFSSIRKSWLEKAYKLNHPVIIDKISGTFVGIDFAGRLNVKLESGKVLTLSEAEVIYK